MAHILLAYHTNKKEIHHSILESCLICWLRMLHLAQSLETLLRAWQQHHKKLWVSVYGSYEFGLGQCVLKYLDLGNTVGRHVSMTIGIKTSTSDATSEG